MALTPSNMMPLGATAPDFCLPDTVSGKEVCLSDVRGEAATVVMFICNHCPFVKHIQGELVRAGPGVPCPWESRWSPSVPTMRSSIPRIHLKT